MITGSLAVLNRVDELAGLVKRRQSVCNVVEWVDGWQKNPMNM